MPKPLAIQLSDAQRTELEDVRDHHPKPTCENGRRRS